MDGDGYSRELEDGWLARAQGDKLIKMATVPTFYLTSTALIGRAYCLIPIGFHQYDTDVKPIQYRTS